MEASAIGVALLGGALLGLGAALLIFVGVKLIGLGLYAFVDRAGARSAPSPVTATARGAG